MTIKTTIIPAGASVGPKERGDWVHLTQEEQTVLSYLVRYARDREKDDNLRKHLDHLLDKLRS